jgi:hypothetical protein
MPYTQVGIANLALLRIGANLLTTISDNTPNALKVVAVWDYLFDEVMQARDWRFAKTRYTMTVSTTSPLYAYEFAYPLPSDFLRLVKPHKPPSKGFNRLASSSWPAPIGYHSNYDWDPPVFPTGFPYVIEAVDITVGQVTTITPCLLTDYDNTAQDLLINYIRKVTNYALCTPAFVNCFADRLAAELAVPIKEDKGLSVKKQQDYRDSLNSAESVNESLDYLEDETQSSSWVDAGRGFWGPR